MPSFKTSLTVDTRVEGLVSNVDYLGNWHSNFIQNKYGRKRRLPRTHVFFCGLQFFFFYGLSIPLMTPKGKKRINKALAKKSRQQFLLFFIFMI